MRNIVKPAFALVLYGEFLTRLSRPLDTPDIFSGVYRPSPTAHLIVSPFGISRKFPKGWCYTFAYSTTGIVPTSGYQLRYAIKNLQQYQAAVNLRGVFSSR
jgi:hypothetical protein